MRVVDLFAGAGGTSTGMSQAGHHVVCAVNHWRLAVDAHALNHPEARHVCQDAATLDPRDLPAHEVETASPECITFSPAKGGRAQPHRDLSRATAWCVVNTAEVTRPTWLVVENVPAFRAWERFPFWRGALASMGYHLEEHVLDAADFGVPQHRSRLFIIGRLGRAPGLRFETRPHVSARAALDLVRGTWSPVHTPRRSPKTLARIARAQARHGADVLVPYYSRGSGLTGRSLDVPCGTLTTKARWALVRGDRMRMLTVEEQVRLMGFPEGYQLAGTKADRIKELGNAVCPPVARAIGEQLS